MAEASGLNLLLVTYLVLERWLGLANGQFPAGFEPHCGKNVSLRNFGNSVYPALPVSFG